MPLTVGPNSQAGDRRRPHRPLLRLLGAAVAVAVLAGCQADEEMSLGSGPKHLREVPRETRTLMAELDMAPDAPVLMRIFKQENAFEVWKKDRSGRYQLLKSYDICKWSGELGPKFKEGDRQAPEGYYMITPALMNPNSSYHLAFNTGYPNAYDRSHGRTGTHLMVHGACSSRGCYAMTDAQIQEIYAIARDAFRGGQDSFQLQAYPFRMTPENMARHVDSPHMPFWRMLKEGYDHFELTRMEPKVDVCGRRYVFNASAEEPLVPTEACPELMVPEPLRVAVAKKAAEDDARMQVIVAQLAEEKREAEEKATMIAAREEERRRREEERRIALAERGETITAFFSGLTGAPSGASAPTPASVVALPRTDEAGRPLPRPAPREAGPALALAAAPAPAAESQSMFTRLFSFGEEPEAPPPPAPAAVAVPSPAPAAVASPVQAPSAAPTTPATLAAATPAALPPGLCAGADGAAVACPAPAPVAPEPAMSTEDRSIIDRIGSWF